MLYWQYDVAISKIDLAISFYGRLTFLTSYGLLDLKALRICLGKVVLRPSKWSCEVNFGFGKVRPIQDAVSEPFFMSRMVWILIESPVVARLTAMGSREVI